MRIAVIGSEGQIGSDLLRCGSSGTEHVLIPFDRLGCDLSQPAQIRRAIEGCRPAVVINAAAWTNVDGAEKDPESAAQLNALAPRIMAEACARIGALFIHYSTDYVFDGRSSTPYRPTDPADPLNTYGRTKLDGEHAILNTDAHAIILRTSWVYSHRRTNFLRTMLRLGREKPVISVVHDQVGAPTASRRIAEASLYIAHLAADRNGAQRGAPRGLFHLSAAGHCTWFEFARAIFDAAPAPRPEVRPITSDAWPSPAQRPAWSVLDCSETLHLLGVQLGDWREPIKEVVADALDETIAASALALSARAG